MASNDSRSDAEVPHVLYHNFWSSCSLMARFSIAASLDASPRDPFIHTEQQIDIQHGGQLAEDFICNVNPKGQVR